MVEIIFFSLEDFKTLVYLKNALFHSASPAKKNIYIYIFKGDAKFLLKGGLILRGFNEKKRSN